MICFLWPDQPDERDQLSVSLEFEDVMNKCKMRAIQKNGLIISCPALLSLPRTGVCHISLTMYSGFRCMRLPSKRFDRSGSLRRSEVEVPTSKLFKEISSVSVAWPVASEKRSWMRLSWLEEDVEVHIKIDVVVFLVGRLRCR